MRSRAYASWRRVPYWTLEDGFLRSVGLGKERARVFSLIVDDLGVYYDASRASRLETIIASTNLGLLAEAGRAARERVVRERLTKYNHLPDRSLALAAGGRPRILLVDQVAGDHSIACGMASAADFRRMLETARRERPEARLIVRIHPDVSAGLAESMLGKLVREEAVEVLDDAVSAHSVLDSVDDVWTVSSQLGFEALLRNMQVTVFGVPFYAGYGLTTDRPGNPSAKDALARRAVVRPSLDAVAGASLVHYPRYVNPAGGHLVTFDEAADQLLAERQRYLSRSGGVLRALNVRKV